MVSISVDLSRAMEKLKKIEKQANFAASKAINETAKAVKAAMVDEMRNKFKKPSRWVLNGLYIKPSTKQMLVATIGAKNGGDGTTANDILTPHVFGGDRVLGKAERLLRNAGILPSGKYAARATGSNSCKFQYTQLLSDMQALRTTRNMNRTASKQQQYFVLKRNGVPVGIAKRKAWGRGSHNSFAMALVFISRPSYGQRLSFAEVAQKTVDAVFPGKFMAAMQGAIDTAN
ncbi:MAG: hypothetical protein RIR18_1284 [Pseudomonadota bacterium]